jgi:hypothetical protein
MDLTLTNPLTGRPFALIPLKTPPATVRRDPPAELVEDRRAREWAKRPAA